MKRFLILMLVACGGPLPEPEVPHALLSGEYWLYFFPGARTGTCDSVPDVYYQRLTFDDAGMAESPVPGVVRCATTYPEGLPSFSCTGAGQTFNVDVHGVGVDPDGGFIRDAWGDGNANGNIKGCKSILFGFGMQVSK